ncbi:MAG: TSUP family transporter [Pseudomonadales bacterium]
MLEALPLEPWMLGLAALIFFAGGMIKGALGFGLPLFAVPLLALVMPLISAITLMGVPVLISNLYQAKLSEPITPLVGRFWSLAVFQVIGVLIGVQILVTANMDALKLGLGCLILLNITLRITRWTLKIPGKNERYAAPVAGLAAGFVGGSTSFVGPLLVLYLSSLTQLDRHTFVRVIALLYLGGLIPMYGSLTALDVFGTSQLLLSLGACVPMLAGIRFGERVRKYCSEALFERLILGALAIIGCMLIVRSALALFGGGN